MRNRCVLICSVLLVLLTTSFVGNAREVEPLTMRDSVNSGPGRVFQLAFTSRAETQFPNDQGFIELRGYAEDLSAPHPGDVLGQFDEAFEALSRAYEVRDEFMVHLVISPVVDPLREDPRYPEWAERMAEVIGRDPEVTG